jgi:hypothetical protein
MSLGSPADIVPFTRFLECRQRLNRLAVANDASATPASTAVKTQPDVTETVPPAMSSVTVIAPTCR